MKIHAAEADIQFPEKSGAGMSLLQTGHRERVSTLTASIRHGTEGPSLCRRPVLSRCPSQRDSEETAKWHRVKRHSAPSESGLSGVGGGRWSLLTAGASTPDRLGETRDHATRMCLPKTKNSLPRIYA